MARVRRFTLSPAFDGHARMTAFNHEEGAADAASLDSRSLLQALSAERPISGSALARHFGVTRTAVWKHIELLRGLGVPIHAQAGSGYRLGAAIELLDAERIRSGLSSALQESLLPSALQVHWQIDSTNSELLRNRDSLPPLAIALAEVQTRGRGRRGRDWHMPLGGGLALSMLRRFDGSMAALAGLSIVVGIGVMRFLEALGVRQAGLKWPNDVLVDGRKLAGILVELGGDALGPCHAVIGVGINVHIDPTQAVAIDQAWVDLAGLAAGVLPSRNQLAASLLDHLMVTLDDFAVGGLASLQTEFSGYDLLRGRPIRVVEATRERHGIARGLNAQGALRVQDSEGEFIVDSGEVSVRSDMPANGARP